MNTLHSRQHLAARRGAMGAAWAGTGVVAGVDDAPFGRIPSSQPVNPVAARGSVKRYSAAH